MDNISLWEAITKRVTQFSEFKNDIEVDVAIIGGGITGLTAALQLIKSGKKIAIVDAYKMGSGTTGYSTGNLYIPVQPYFQNIRRKFDEKTTKSVAEARKWAIDFIETTVREKNIDCHFTRRPWYLYADDQGEIDFLAKEVNTLKNAGIAIDYTNELPFDLKFKKAALLPNQARFNPLQYVLSIAEFLKEKGCLIFENTPITEIMEESKYCVFKTTKGKITAKKGIVATHTPLGINTIHLCTAPYRSYVVAVKLKKLNYPDCQIWNLKKPHYVISTHSTAGENPDTLLLAGSHHKTGQSDDTLTHYKELEKYLDKHFEIQSLSHKWSAQHYQAADDIPYIGLKSGSKHLYYATGYFADGLVYGTVAGILISDMIHHKINPWRKVFNSKRHTWTASAGFCIKENLNVLKHYLMDLPYFNTPEIKDIKKDEGKVIEINSEKLGVYRDKQDKLHIVSAVCTHMKCIVNWNTAEKTWDCPCHGSRFSIDGKVLEGPAEIALTVRHKEKI